MHHLRRNTILILCMLLFLTGCHAEKTVEPENGNPASLPVLVERSAPSVCKIEVFDNKSKRMTMCSGTVLFDSTVLVTCRHVLTNLDHMTVTRDDGHSFELSRDSVLFSDRDSDIAFLRLPESEVFSPLPTAQKMPARGEWICTISSQAGMLNLVSEGIISGTFEKEGKLSLLFNAPVTGGSSGGALMNNSGEVVGIISGMYTSDNAQNMNLAVPVETVISLYDKYLIDEGAYNE